jgi:uncharacterized phage-like protein YoqJ
MTMTHSPIDFSKSELLFLDVHVWGGKTKLYKEDLVLTETELPPDRLANLGTIQVVDPKDIAELNALKRAAERACLRWGSRFLGGFLESQEKSKELSEILADLKKTFDAVTHRIVTTRHDMIQRWADANPEWSALIVKAADRAIARSHEPYFRYTPINVVAATTNPGALAEASVMIGSQILREISQDAKEAYERSLQGKESCTRKALGPLVRMREKLYALRFVSVEAVDIIFDIDQVLGALPKTGPLDGTAFESLVALTLRLKNGDVRKGAHSPFSGMRGLEDLPDLITEPVSAHPQMGLPLPVAVVDTPTLAPVTAPVHAPDLAPVVPQLPPERSKRAVWF